MHSAKRTRPLRQCDTAGRVSGYSRRMRGQILAAPVPTVLEESGIPSSTLPDGSNGPVGFHPVDRWKQKSDMDSETS